MISIDELKQRYIDGSLEYGLFTSGDNRIVRVFSGGFAISTLQDNGWTRINYYEYVDDEWVESETYEK